MTKEEHSNQLNLTVVALVALVAIVGLVALVMNAASITPRIATGSQVVSADAEENVAGQAIQDWGGAENDWSGASGGGTFNWASSGSGFKSGSWCDRYFTKCQSICMGHNSMAQCNTYCADQARSQSVNGCKRG